MYTTNKPAVARFKNVFVSEVNTPIYRQLSTGACAVVSVVLTAGGSAATIRVVDVANIGNGTGYALESGFALAVESSNSVVYCPAEGYPMKNGLALVFEQGEGSNAECTITYE
jgi:hypothetical protein